MKILLLSAYDAASHQRWRQELEEYFPEHQWTQLSLPPRYFSWRVRGNSLSWAFSQRELLSQTYDVLIATSMVDLSSLRGFVPELARIPTLIYFHENQFAYPPGEDQLLSVEPQITSIYSALCADNIIFNSAFNRDSFLAGAETLLRRLPDHVPLHVMHELSARSQVVPVPLRNDYFVAPAQRSPRPSLIWNHRWEYDKGPERLLAMLRYWFSAGENPPITVHVVGQQFRQQPPVFTEIKDLLLAQDSLGEWGFVEDAGRYRQLLRESHIAVSTAVHDFQGLAVLEAVAAGCVPLVPARQAYPEWFGAEACYPSLLEDVEGEGKAMAGRLRHLVQQIMSGEKPLAPDLSHLSWSGLRLRYKNLLEFCS